MSGRQKDGQESNKSNGISDALNNETKSLLAGSIVADPLIATPNSTSLPQKNDGSYPPKSDEEWLRNYAKKILASSSSTEKNYHQAEIANMNKLVNGILASLAGVTVITLALVALFVCFDKNTGAIICGAVGGIIDAILGVLGNIFHSSVKYKKAYFDAETDKTKFDKMLWIIQTIKDETKRDDLIVEVVKEHFKTLEKD